MKDKVPYQVICGKYSDNGTYYVISSSSVQGLVAVGCSLKEAIKDASYDIADWFKIKGKIEKVADPSSWKLKKNEKLIYVKVALPNI